MEVNIITSEGKCEQCLANHLIDRGVFFLTRDDIFDSRPFHIRQLKELANYINSLPIDTEINVYRIGDTQKDKYDLKPFSLRENNIHIHKICTKPEIEILIIINENKYEDYMKSGMTPKSYVKAYLKECYSFEDYISTHDIVPAIKKYKHLKKHKKDELFLSDFIND